MPYKSDAQRRFFHAAESRGDIKPSTVEEFDKVSKGMKLPEHIKKLYEGGLIDEKEYQDFNARYHTSEGPEQREEQPMPAMGSEDGSKRTEHQDSEMPSKGADPYLTALFNDYRDDAEPEEMPSDEPSRDFLDALRRRKRS
jgi:hypothetical protein